MLTKIIQIYSRMAIGKACLKNLQKKQLLYLDDFIVFDSFV